MFSCFYHTSSSRSLFLVSIFLLQTVSAQIDVSPTEDLMREHGVLNRILLIYEEAITRLRKNKPLDPKIISTAANIIRDFIEDYHEKLEEDYLFPKFEQMKRSLQLVKTLRKQHLAGRKLTDIIKKYSSGKAFKKKHNKKSLIKALQSFITMYRHHEAREDTELFPQLHSMISLEEYKKLGDLFEDEEEKRFGKNGFQMVVSKVEDLEKQLGTHDLDTFTPKP